MLHILVCVKPVPAYSNNVLTDNGLIDRERTTLEINIADLSALEAAFQCPFPHDVTVLMMGPKKTESLIRELFSRGADHALLISDIAVAGSDTIATARVLLSAIRYLSVDEDGLSSGSGKGVNEEDYFDVILCGRRALDGETGQVPGILAAMLNRPFIGNAQNLEYNSDGVTITRAFEDHFEKLYAGYPILLSMCEYSYLLRLPTLEGLQSAMGKAVQTVGIHELDLDREMTGQNGSETNVVRVNTISRMLRKGPRVMDAERAAMDISRWIKGASCG